MSLTETPADPSLKATDSSGAATQDGSDKQYKKASSEPVNTSQTVSFALPLDFTRLRSTTCLLLVRTVVTESKVRVYWSKDYQ